MNDTAYLRWIEGYGTHAQFVNGCPTLLIESEPVLVVRKNSKGKLEIFSHYRYTTKVEA